MFQWGEFSKAAYKSILGSSARINLWEGSVRSSKTISSIVRWMRFVKQAPSGGVLVMVGKTQRTLQRNILDVIQEMYPNPNVCHLNRGTGEFFLFGKKIDILGANDERAQEKIRGATIVGAYCDEISLFPESFFRMLLSRLSVKGSKLFGTTNPDSPYHWLKVDFIDRWRELDISVFHFEIDDNPNLDPEFVRNLKLEYTGLWYKRFISGLWVLADGTIYDMWDEDNQTVNVIEILSKRETKQFKRYFTACDYGTNNPCTFGLYGYDVHLPVYLVKEYYYDGGKTGKQKTDSEYADAFVDFIKDVKPVNNYFDPSALSFMAELRKRGVTVTPAKNDVIDGIRFVASMLAAKAYMVDIGCKQTIREFSGYVWDAKAQKRGEDVPLKQNDHAMDRDRYALFTHFFTSGAGILKGFNYD
jgi:PBSX family phage terminase large subunit